LGEYLHTKSDSLAEIRITIAKIQNFYWHTLYI